MMRVFEKSTDLFGGQATTGSDDEVVVSDLAINVRARNLHHPSLGVDAQHFSLYESNSHFGKFVSKVKGYIVRRKSSECHMYESRIERKSRVGRYKCYTVISTERLGKSLRRYKARKASADNQDVCHDC